jgi:WD40 repeat protein
MAVRGHGNRVCSIKMMEDGYTYVTGGWDKNFIVWDLRKPEAIHQFLAVKVSGNSLCFKNGSLFAGYSPYYPGLAPINLAYPYGMLTKVKSSTISCGEEQKVRIRPMCTVCVSLKTLSLTFSLLALFAFLSSSYSKEALFTLQPGQYQMFKEELHLVTCLEPKIEWHSPQEANS